jgi:hypothetical protein
MTEHHPGFVVFGLPRSRTTWLSQFLTYGDWVCGHDELRHMRSLDDISTWFSQPLTGTVETSAAAWWRLLPRFAPDARVAIVRRPVAEVVESMMRLPRVTFDRATLTKAMEAAARKLDQISARIGNVFEIGAHELSDEDRSADLFEFCLPGYVHDRSHWWMLENRKIETDFYALTRYCEAYRSQMERLAAIAKHQTLSAMSLREPVAPGGVTFQEEDFATWLEDARPLYREHLVLVGESPDDWSEKNLELMETLFHGGAMQITTARCNGRMFGYLMTLISPSLTSSGVTSATHTTFYADPSMPGLGLKIQRDALRRLKEKGISEVFMEAGKRGSGPRIETMFRRIGADRHGEVYRLQLEGVS